MGAYKRCNKIDRLRILLGIGGILTFQEFQFA